MGKSSCILRVKVGNSNNDSKLYEDLVKDQNLANDRPTANYIYAAYLQKGVAEAMDKVGYLRDKNGEHFKKDVYAFFDVSNILRERFNRASHEAQLGIKDGEEGLYSADDALEKVINYNTNVGHNPSSNKLGGFIAYTVRDGDKYRIRLVERSSQTAYLEERMNNIYDNFIKAKDILTKNGIDPDLWFSTFSDIFDATDIPTTINWLNNFVKTATKNLSQKDILLLFQSLPKDSDQRSRLISSFGNLEEAAKVLYEHYNGIATSKLTEGKLGLLDTIIKLQKDKFANITKKIQKEVETLEAEKGFSFSVADIIKELHSRYNIDDIRTRIVLGKKIKTSSDAAGKAVILLNRRLEELERKQKDDPNNEILSKQIFSMLEKIDKTHNAQAIIQFLSIANEDVFKITNVLTEIKSPEGSKEWIRDVTSAINECNATINTYYDMLKALSTFDKLIIDEEIDSSYINSIKTQATELLGVVQNKIADIEMMKESAMLAILTDVFGKELPDGLDTTTLLQMARQDSSLLDYIYSFSKQTNPVISAMGGITRHAQDQRLTKLNDINIRLQQAEHKLRKAGHSDTSFMYEAEYDKLGKIVGYMIISPYDFASYKKERAAFANKLKKAGVKGFAFKEKIKEWEDKNTQEVVVDEKTGRTERVPNKTNKNLNEVLDEAQLEYYNTVMQIKGELGTMLPEYAQHQFLPPQVRRDLLDVPLKQWPSAIWERVRNFWNREGDLEMLGVNAIYSDSEAFAMEDANIDDTVRKAIPIFYTRRLKDQGELITKDFSGAMTYLASTAVNYSCMSNVLDIVRFMGDYVTNVPIIEKREGETLADEVNGQKIKIIQRLFKKAKDSRLQSIVDGFIDAQFFGQSLKSQNAATKWIKSLLKYSQFRMLSTNVFGATSNFVAGRYQILIQALGSTDITITDLMAADAVMFGNKVLKSPGKLFDFLLNNTSSFDTLLGNFFDPDEDYVASSKQRVTRNIFKKLLREDYSMKLYGIGENLIHYALMYAKLFNEKVLINGKKSSLYSAFETSEREDGNKVLKIKDGVTTLDGKSLTDLTDDYFKEIRNKIRKLNQDCHGAMSMEDRGVFSQWMAGRMVMQMRQWMVDTFSSRLRGLHYEGITGDWREGWWTTMFKQYIRGAYDDGQKLALRDRFKLSNLNYTINQYEEERKNRTLSDSAFKALQQKARLAQNRKANIKKFWAETALILALMTCSLMFGDSEDYENTSWLTRFLIYLEKRLTTEAIAATPVGVVTEAKSIVKNPVLSISTLSGLMYPITGLVEIGDTYETGKYAGESKYLHKIATKTLPFYKDYLKLTELEDDSSYITYFDLNYQLTR